VHVTDFAFGLAADESDAGNGEDEQGKESLLHDELLCRYEFSESD
jgi:hypothetical protein